MLIRFGKMKESVNIFITIIYLLLEEGGDENLRNTSKPTLITRG